LNAKKDDELGKAREARDHVKCKIFIVSTGQEGKG
jgi:hypothetical protein